MAGLLAMGEGAAPTAWARADAGRTGAGRRGEARVRRLAGLRSRPGRGSRDEAAYRWIKPAIASLGGGWLAGIWLAGSQPPPDLSEPVEGHACLGGSVPLRAAAASAWAGPTDLEPNGPAAGVA